MCSLISGLGGVNNCGLVGEVGKDVLEPVLSNCWKHCVVSRFLMLRMVFLQAL